MKKIVLLCMAVAFCIGTNLYAADGDLFVRGMVSIGTTTPVATLSLKGNCTKALTGTVAVTKGSIWVTGTNALFGTEVVIGQAIKIGSELFHVSGIGSNQLILSSSYQGESASGLTAYIEPNNLSVDDGAGTNVITVSRGFVGIGIAAPAAKLDIVGNQKTKGAIAFGSAAPGTARANKALCWTSTGIIGYCSNAINSSGTCTCNQIN